MITCKNDPNPPLYDEWKRQNVRNKMEHLSLKNLGPTNTKVF